MNNLALDRLEVRPGERVLEIGFGGGALLRRLQNAWVHPVGADISEAMVRRARPLDVFLASAEALPFDAGSFDKAVSVNSVYFWPDPAEAFRELHRVLKPQGRLVLCFEPSEELRKWPGHRHGFRLFDIEELRALMEAAGFGDIGEVWDTGRKPDRFCCLSGTRVDANR